MALPLCFFPTKETNLILPWKIKINSTTHFFKKINFLLLFCVFNQLKKIYIRCCKVVVWAWSWLHHRSKSYQEDCIHLWVTFLEIRHWHTFVVPSKPFLVTHSLSATFLHCPMSAWLLPMISGTLGSRTYSLRPTDCSSFSSRVSILRPQSCFTKYARCERARKVLWWWIVLVEFTYATGKNE